MTGPLTPLWLVPWQSRRFPSPARQCPGVQMNRQGILATYIPRGHRLGPAQLTQLTDAWKRASGER